MRPENYNLLLKRELTSYKKDSGSRGYEVSVGTLPLQAIT